MAGRPAGRSSLGARAGRWRAQAGRPAGRTCTLDTQSSGLGGGGSWRVEQSAARHGRRRPQAGRLDCWTCTLGTLSCGLGGGGARRFVQPAGRACSALCRAVWVVAGPGGRSRPPALHARCRPGCWRAQAGRLSGRTFTLDTLSRGLGCDRAQRVVQLAGLACLALCRSAWVVAGPGWSNSQPLGPWSPAWALAGTGGSFGQPDLHTWHFVKRPGL